MRQFLEVESAHYKDLAVLISGDGEYSRVELFKKGKLVDSIPVFRWSIEEMRALMSDLGLTRDEKRTWESLEKEQMMAEAFMRPPGENKKEGEEKEDL